VRFRRLRSFPLGAISLIPLVRGILRLTKANGGHCLAASLYDLDKGKTSLLGDFGSVEQKNRRGAHETVVR